MSGVKLYAYLQSVLLVSTNAQECRIEDAAIFIGLVALGADLRLFVVPAAQFFTMLPDVRQDGNGTAIHEAGNAFDISLVAFVRFENLRQLRFEQWALPAFQADKPLA